MKIKPPVLNNKRSISAINTDIFKNKDTNNDMGNLAGLFTTQIPI